MCFKVHRRRGRAESISRNKQIRIRSDFKNNGITRRYIKSIVTAGTPAWTVHRCHRFNFEWEDAIPWDVHYYVLRDFDLAFGVALFAFAVFERYAHWNDNYAPDTGKLPPLFKAGNR